MCDDLHYCRLDHDAVEAAATAVGGADGGGAIDDAAAPNALQMYQHRSHLEHFVLLCWNWRVNCSSHHYNHFHLYSDCHLSLEQNGFALCPLWMAVDWDSYHVVSHLKYLISHWNAGAVAHGR